jgi:hypothetical protein
MQRISSVGKWRRGQNVLDCLGGGGSFLVCDWVLSIGRAEVRTLIRRCDICSITKAKIVEEIYEAFAVNRFEVVDVEKTVSAFQQSCYATVLLGTDRCFRSGK